MNTRAEQGLLKIKENNRRYLSSSSYAFLAFCSGWLLLSSALTSAKSEECTKGIAVPEEGDYSDWPELFRLTSEYPEDPTLSNRDETIDSVDPAVLLASGVGYHFLDPSGFTYPNRTKEIPWSPPLNGTNDPKLQELRNESDYQYADIVVVTSYNEGFYEEHLHAGGDEVRYVIDGSGYFDIRDVNDEWVRMHAKAGAFIIFPSGIEHRFSVDDTLYVQAMRLFPGSGDPDWSSVSRSETHGNITARNNYVDMFLCGIDPDLDHGMLHEDDHDHDISSAIRSRVPFVALAMSVTAVLAALLGW